MTKSKNSTDNFNPKKKFIDILYSEFDSDPDSEEDPEWLPENQDLISASEESEESSEESEESSEESGESSSASLDPP